MRRLAWALLLLFAFTIPWQYSLVAPAPFGNVARIAGLVALFAAISAVLQAGRLRTPVAFHWMVLALFLWWCCTGFWSVDPAATLSKLRGFFQEMMIVWLVWELTESAADLRALLRAWVAGSWVLALLTLANFASAEALAASRIRYVAAGQDPNDVARFICLGIALAALLFRCEKRWSARVMALAFLPVGLLAALLTASRSGSVEAVIALAGCAVVLSRGRAKAFAAGVLALPAAVAAFWMVIPRGTLERLASIPTELQGGDLNQRINIWSLGWDAFLRSPMRGSGAGTFVSAAQTAPIDTAHNTLLSIAVTGGLCALFLAAAVVAATAFSVAATRGLLRVSLATCLTLWSIASFTATVEESRSTWLLLGVIAVAARLAAERGDELEACFEPPGTVVHSALDPRLAAVST
jgi:O-antigen ligase